ncbi:hypothetical protein E4U46_004242 [Claviceps purpurea]|nr:hypothetical protein E4U51_002357 [Claviceps purpurea]KAG6191749.1 hypothetical protein E4U36_005817 [Claviceps purpurea]KAG6239838.1 hypothetical protein E4U23_007685 [Claviceps purpurea]KAG6295624.1 hypothetical protein E4U46_004242 [Claviceps purpurea]KAG6306090.1 hypothetical protein E4U45_007841 [Claviceps purpurea]
MAPQKTIQLEGIKVSTDCKSLENVEQPADSTGLMGPSLRETTRTNDPGGSELLLMIVTDQ